MRSNQNDFPEIEGGFPHSEIHGSKLIRSSPRLIAAYHVLHRLCMPRHPPDALKTLDRSHCQCPSGHDRNGQRRFRPVRESPGRPIKTSFSRSVRWCAVRQHQSNAAARRPPIARAALLATQRTRVRARTRSSLHNVSITGAGQTGANLFSTGMMPRTRKPLTRPARKPGLRERLPGKKPL